MGCGCAHTGSGVRLQAFPPAAALDVPGSMRAAAGWGAEAESSVSLPPRGFYERRGYRIGEARLIDGGGGQRLDRWQARKRLAREKADPPPRQKPEASPGPDAGSGAMRRTITLFSAVAVIFLISIAIVDSVSSLSGYLLNNAWLGVIGRWRDARNAGLEIEFREDGTYREYSGGVLVSSGEYRAEGDVLVIDYKGAACRGEHSNNCSRRVHFVIGDKAIMILEGGTETEYLKE
jgi:hypothetical protein